MRLRHLLFIPLLLAACAKKDGRDLAVYQDAQSGFSCKAPAAWRVLEDQGGAQLVSFFGPPSGERPFHAAINIYHHKKGTPQSYALKQTAFAKSSSPLRKLKLGSRDVFEFILERESLSMHGKPPEQRRERFVLVPSEKGFFALVHATPIRMQDETRPAFEAVLESLKI